MQKIGFLFALSAIALSHCGSGNPSNGDAGNAPDASPEAAADATADAPIDAGDAQQVLTPLPDFVVGPYGSAYGLFRPILEYGKKYDCTIDTSPDGGPVPELAAAEAYEVQAAAQFLEAARGWSLPGGEADRTHIVDVALAIVDNLIACDGLVLGGGPGWGLYYAWDAFGDGTTTPAFTEYAWETGMAVLGIVELARVIEEDPKLAAYQSRAASLAQLGKQVIDVWHSKGYSNLSAIQKPEWGFYWYSLNPNDAKAVYNTTGLLSMAEVVLAPLLGDSTYDARALGNFEYFRDAALSVNSTTNAFVWSYGGYGYASSATPEDSSHGTVNERWMRFEMDRGNFDAAHAAHVQDTILDVIYQGNPARLAYRVDGSSDATYDWAYAAATALGSSVWGDAIPAAQGGRVEIWELARNVYLSAQLEAHQPKLANPIVSALDALVIAQLFLHRPAELAPDSRWVMKAGDSNDQAAPTTTNGGVRFYTTDWSAPTQLSDPALPNHPPITYRTATATNANLVVDLPPAQTNAVVVSITYRASTAGSIQQWNGSSYETLAPMPATTVPEQTAPVFFRISFRLDPKAYFDYQGTVSGTNVLLQATASGIEVAEIEATPL